jgi:hypothetical protein
MKNILLAFIVKMCIGLSPHLLTNTAIAQQPCNDDAIMNTKGHWAKRSDAIVFPDSSFPKSQFIQANNRVDKMQKLLQTAYPDPKGIEAGWYRGITGKAEVKNGPAPYSLEALFLAHYCNGKKIELGDETGTWFYVWANQVSGWFAEYEKYYRIQKQPVYLLQKRAGTLNGQTLYEGINNGTSNTGSRYSRFIMILRTGNSPYIPVTQKQFLQAFLNYNEKRFTKYYQAELEKSKHFKTDQEEEANRQDGLKRIEKVNTPESWERRKADYLKNYKTDKQQKEEWLIKLSKNYEEDMKPAHTMLDNGNPQELEQPAILDFENLLMFKHFSTSEQGGRELVRLNPDYFNTSLPKYIPQLLVVYWSWDKNKPGMYFNEQIEKHFDFNALQNMLDK